MDKQQRYSYVTVMIMCLFQRHSQQDPMVLGLSQGHIHICLNNVNYTIEFLTIAIHMIHLYIIHWRMYSWAISIHVIFSKHTSNQNKLSSTRSSFIICQNICNLYWCSLASKCSTNYYLACSALMVRWSERVKQAQ